MIIRQEIEQRTDWVVVTSDYVYTGYMERTIEEIADELSWEFHRYGETWEYCLAYDNKNELKCYIVYPDGSYDEVEQC